MIETHLVTLLSQAGVGAARHCGRSCSATDDGLNMTHRQGPVRRPLARRGSPSSHPGRSSKGRCSKTTRFRTQVIFSISNTVVVSIAEYMRYPPRRPTLDD
ncbi:hypothetical protein J6590_099997 [Homalodisca vitripennis]|nr:hypothetical protein J6590_099997 [Homalodisca vitripennis]